MEEHTCKTESPKFEGFRKTSAARRHERVVADEVADQHQDAHAGGVYDSAAHVNSVGDACDLWPAVLEEALQDPYRSCRLGEVDEPLPVQKGYQ